MKQRVLTALLLAPLAIAAVLWLPTAAFLLLVAVILLAGLWEWARLTGLADRRARSVLLAVHALVMAWLIWRGSPQQLVPLAAAGAAWWVAVLLWLGNHRLGRPVASGPRLLELGAGSLMVLPTLAALALLHGGGELGPRWALFAVFLVWTADTFAYFVGSRLGGPKLAPVISPNKTWSGFLGGLCGAALICIPALPLLGLGWSALGWLMLLGLVTALASVIGDLFESLIKRHAGAKDSGALIPGHGGVMDRLDSIVAAVPVFAIGKLWLFA
jgi:phosphatidate cytidylyltransferase